MAPFFRSVPHFTSATCLILCLLSSVSCIHISDTYPVSCDLCFVLLSLWSALHLRHLWLHRFCSCNLSTSLLSALSHFKSSSTQVLSLAFSCSYHAHYMLTHDHIHTHVFHTSPATHISHWYISVTTTQLTSSLTISHCLAPTFAWLLLSLLSYHAIHLSNHVHTFITWSPDLTDHIHMTFIIVESYLDFSDFSQLNTIFALSLTSLSWLILVYCHDLLCSDQSLVSQPSLSSFCHLWFIHHWSSSLMSLLSTHDFYMSFLCLVLSLSDSTCLFPLNAIPILDRIYLVPFLDILPHWPSVFRHSRFMRSFSISCWLCSISLCLMLWLFLFPARPIGLFVFSRSDIHLSSSITYLLYFNILAVLVLAQFVPD
jgi:hypothetical protein